MDPTKKTTYIVAAISLIVIAAAVYFLFIFKKPIGQVKVQKQEEEVVALSQLEVIKRPYVTMTPTADGAEIVISLENMAFFDRIEYELTYLADNPQVKGEKIERGSTGTDVNTKDAKYKKSILLGTASRGVRSPDTGITDGKLTLHLFKGESEYQSESVWDLMQFGVVASTIKSRQGDFELKVGSLGKNYWVILADTVGIPANISDDPKKVILPIYGVFSITPKFSKPADLSIKVNDGNLKLYLYDHQAGVWQKIDSLYDLASKTLTAKVPSLGTFVLVSSK